MDFIVRKAIETDRTAVIDIFNHFVENGFAAFPEKKLNYEFFDKFKEAARSNSFYVIEVPELSATSPVKVSETKSPERMEPSIDASLSVDELTRVDVGAGTELPAASLMASPPPTEEVPTEVIPERPPKAVVAVSEKRVIGFALLKTHNPVPVFDRTAELAYYILPEYVNKGFETLFLELLLADAKGMGVDSVLAEVSSLNDASIKFHKKNGFAECGRFKRIGKKKGKDFDVVWMQKFV
jgi:L-amino acid N-acyltransferase YncA